MQVVEELTQASVLLDPTDLETPAHPETAVPPPGPTPRKFSARTRLRHALKRIAHGLEAAAPYLLPILPNRGIAAETQVDGRTVRYYKHWPKDPRVIAEWDCLARNTPLSTPFQSPSWQHAAARVPDATGLLRLVTVHEGDRLVAAVPFERRWGGHWRTIGSIVTAFHDPLVHPKDAAGTFRAMFHGITQLDHRVRSVTFELLSPDSRCVTMLPPAAHAAGFQGGEAPTTVCDSTIDLPSTWDGYLASLKKNDRSKLRRRLKKVEESGQAQFVVSDTPETVAKALPQVLELLERSQGSKGRRAKWLFRPHLKLAAPELARTGRLIVYQLFIDGQLANGDIVLVGGNRLLMWNGAMDDRLRDWSPGIATLAMIIRDAIAHGRTCVDFLRGNFDYKRELGAVLRPMHKLVFTR